jgi:hypothetical protein
MVFGPVAVLAMNVASIVNRETEGHGRLTTLLTGSGVTMRR